MKYPFKSLEEKKKLTRMRNIKSAALQTCYFLKFEAAKIAKNCYFVDLDSRAELLCQ